MSRKLLTAALGALLAVASLAGTTNVAQAATTPIACHLAGTSTPVPSTGHLEYSSATLVCSARTGMFVKDTLSDNADHAKDVKGTSAVNVTELATGSATLPEVAGHSYGAIVSGEFQRTANTGPWTKFSYTFAGGRGTSPITGSGLEWDGLEWDGLAAPAPVTAAAKIVPASGVNLASANWNGCTQIGWNYCSWLDGSMDEFVSPNGIHYIQVATSGHLYNSALTAAVPVHPGGIVVVENVYWFPYDGNGDLSNAPAAVVNHGPAVYNTNPWYAATGWTFPSFGPGLYLLMFSTAINLNGAPGPGTLGYGRWGGNGTFGASPGLLMSVDHVMR